MQANIINRGHLYLCDLTETNFKFSRPPFTIYEYSSSVSYGRDEDGEPNGSARGDISISVKLSDETDAKVFMEGLNLDGLQTFSVVFNRKIDNNTIKDFRNAEIISGYIYDLDEDYMEGLMISFKIKPSSILYLGEDNDSVQLNISKI